MSKHYYRFIATTPCCGTDSETYKAFDYEPTEEELNEFADECCADNAASYEYLVYGWDEDLVESGEMTQEEFDETMENYYADCQCTWEEISEEEYNENNVR